MKPISNKNDTASSMTLEEATTYLKKIGEWESVWRFDRDTIIGWANFLKNKENLNITSKNKPTKKAKRESINNL